MDKSKYPDNCKIYGPEHSPSGVGRSSRRNSSEPRSGWTRGRPEPTPERSHWLLSSWCGPETVQIMRHTTYKFNAVNPEFFVLWILCFYFQHLFLWQLNLKLIYIYLEHCNFRETAMSNSLTVNILFVSIFFVYCLKYVNHLNIMQ